jgi:hypothetical protein
MIVIMADYITKTTYELVFVTVQRLVFQVRTEVLCTMQIDECQFLES